MNRLKELRESKGLSQKEFAKAFSEFILSNKKYALYDVNGKEKSISYATVSRWENGKTPIPSVYFAALADYFGVIVPYFEGTELYKIYVYYTTYGDQTFLTVAKSREQADKMLSNELRFDPYYKPSDFEVTTYPVDKAMIEEL